MRSGLKFFVKERAVGVRMCNQSHQVVHRNLSLPAYLKLGPLDPADASSSISPGQLGAEYQFRFPQVVRSGGSDFIQNFLPPLLVRTSMQPLDRGVVLIHEVLSQTNHFVRGSGRRAAAGLLMLPVH